MPPRKSNASAAGGEEDAVVQKSVSKEPKDDALSVEVCQLPHAPAYLSTTVELTPSSFTGPQPPQINRPKTRQRRPTSQHPNPKRCLTSHVEKRNSICQLHHFMVRLTPTAQLLPTQELVEKENTSNT